MSWRKWLGLEPEHRSKISEGMKRHYREHPRTKEHNERIGEGMRLRWRERRLAKDDEPKDSEDVWRWRWW